jgi:hypothetical protein
MKFNQFNNEDQNFKSNALKENLEFKDNLTLESNHEILIQGIVNLDKYFKKEIHFNKNNDKVLNEFETLKTLEAKDFFDSLQKF